MAKLTTSEVRQAAKEIILRNPQGIRYGEIVKQLVAMHPETNRNMIETQVCCLDVNLPSEILKPSRGLYKPAGLHGTEQGQTAQAVGKPTGVRVTEEEFYAPFAQYLKTNLGEVTVAMSLGGAAMKGKWGTPDVIGAYKPLASHRIKFDIEIVSAEIKIDPQAPVVAFGQAIAYRLFSTKVYAVMPNTLAEEDNRRTRGTLSAVRNWVGFFYSRQNRAGVCYSCSGAAVFARHVVRERFRGAPLPAQQGNI